MNRLIGILLIAVSAAAIYPVYIIVGTGVTKQVSAMQSSTIIFASAGLVYGVATAVSGAHFPGTEAGWNVVAGVVIVATVMPGRFFGGTQTYRPDQCVHAFHA